MDSSWVLKAIEREAMNRAMAEVIRAPQDYVRIFGLTIRQMAFLKYYYQKQTGLRAEDIT